MSYNGSGVYTLPGAQLANGATVSATENNQFRNDVAAALNVAWTRDGQAPATNDIPMGSNKLTELAQPTTEGDALAFGKNATVDDLAVTGNQTVTGNSDVTGNETVGGNLTVTGTASLGGQYFTPYTGFKNRIINGSMQTAQRGTSATITAGSTIAAGYSTVDRFYVYCTGANVTAAQVAGSGATQNRLQITGAASVTAVGVGQRIEQFNSYDLAGSTATLSVDLANSLLTTVTWTAYYANTANTFGTLASPTRTQIATGTFTVTSTVTNYNTQISVPAAATTGIEIVFTVGAQTSGTWTIGNVQLEKGSTATSFDYRPYGTELQLCQRYYFGFKSTNPGTGNPWDSLYTGAIGCALSTTDTRGSMPIPVSMRATPSVNAVNCWSFGGSPLNAGACTVTIGSIADNNIRLSFGFTGMTQGGIYQLAFSGSANGLLEFSAEL